MAEIVTWIWSASHWHWWAVAVALIALEVTVPTTYFLWPAAAAVVTGALVWIYPDLDWQLQILIFALLSVLTVYGWHRWQKKQPPKSDAAELNVRANRYLGMRLTLDEPLVNGRGRARVDDSWWQVASIDGGAIDAGKTVEVVSHDGTTLIVKA